jgi:hypothetical protein
MNSAMNFIVLSAQGFDEGDNEVAQLINGIIYIYNEKEHTA